MIEYKNDEAFNFETVDCEIKGFLFIADNEPVGWFPKSSIINGTQWVNECFGDAWTVTSHTIKLTAKKL